MTSKMPSNLTSESQDFRIWLHDRAFDGGYHSSLWQAMTHERKFGRLIGWVAIRFLAVLLALAFLLFAPLVADRLYETTVSTIGVAPKCAPVAQAEVAKSAASSSPSAGMSQRPIVEPASWVVSASKALGSAAMFVLAGDKGCVVTEDAKKGEAASERANYFAFGQIVVYDKNEKEKNGSGPGARALVILTLVFLVIGLVWPGFVIHLIVASFVAGSAIGLLFAAGGAIWAGSPMALLLTPLALLVFEVCARLLHRLRCRASAWAAGELRYPGRDWRRGLNPADEAPTPLASQRATIDRLLDACDILRPNQPGQRPSRLASGKLVCLFGRRGQGKSLIIDWFRRKAQIGGHAAILINVWTMEAEPELEYAVMRAIADDWRIARRGWLHFPATWIAIGRLIGNVKLSIKAVVGDMEVSTPTARPPRIMWRSTLRKMVAATVGAESRPFLARPRRRVVVVLDDVDRCSPLVAQQIVTLAKRFLDVPDLTVVLACDENILRNRVFDPLNALLPDLASVAEDELVMRYATPLLWSKTAENYGAALRGAANAAIAPGELSLSAVAKPTTERTSETTETPSSPPASAASSAKEAEKEAKSTIARRTTVVTKSGGESDPCRSDCLDAPTPWGTIAQPYRDLRRRLLALTYLGDQDALQASLRGRISDKYLTESAIDVADLSADDLNQLLASNSAWRSLVLTVKSYVEPQDRDKFERALREDHLDEADYRGSASAMVRAVLAQTGQRRENANALITMRDLIGALNRELPRAEERLKLRGQMISADWARLYLSRTLFDALKLAEVHSY